MADNSSIDSVSRNIIQAQEQYSEIASSIQSQQQQIELCLQEAGAAIQAADEARAQSDIYLQEARYISRTIAQLESEREQIQFEDRSSNQSNSDGNSRFVRLNRQIAENRANRQRCLDKSDSFKQKADDLQKRSDDLRHDAQHSEDNLSKQCNKCGSVADSLGKCAAVMQQEAVSVRAQSSALGRAASGRYGASAASNAQQVRERQAEALENYAELANSLSEQYRLLANMINNSPTDCGGQSVGKNGSTLSERATKLAFNAMVMGSIVTGMHGVSVAKNGTYDSVLAQTSAISEAFQNIGQDDFLDGYEILGSNDEEQDGPSITYYDKPKH